MVRKGRGRVVALLGCLAVLLATQVNAADAAVPAPTGPSPNPGAAPARAGAAVTLLTGDTVTLDNPVAGTPSVSMRPGNGDGASYSTLRRNGDVYVVPDDIAHLVPRVLDLELFNVTELIAMGYGDSATGSLPLIVQGARPTAALGTREVLPLPSIDAVAVRVAKQDGLAATLAARGGVRKVWLDRRFQASELDPNLTQIGAPGVWAGGLTGTGVDIAVLDTGVDRTHADLRDKLVAEANFTGEDSATDTNGHGTHVASVVAGTGVAADGARKGVAHDARLLSGKVLGADGSGQSSWIIAGMQWAAERDADVINMSLGARARQGADPVVQALERLTEQTGALFVVAAGNSGPAASSIESPGVAPSALTVGAANRDGVPAHFSSVGPTAGGTRSKPDLTAPGVDIRAAEAGGGDTYTEMTGTSQATPHVAGAAALLRQQHPDWGRQRIKTTLMTTADASQQPARPHFEGAGLLDLAGATTDPLLLDRGAVDFGYLRYPEGERPRTIELSLTNTGAEPLELSFADSARDARGRPAPADIVTVRPADLSVAPGESERVAVTLTPANGDPGMYSGAVTMTGAGREPASLPLSFYAEAARYDVQLTVLDRHGEPDAGGTVWLANMAEMHPRHGGGFKILQLDGNGEGTARMAPGPISMMTKVKTPATDAEPETVTLAGSPEVMVQDDISYTIDARTAQRLEPARVQGRDTTVAGLSVHYGRQDAKSSGRIEDGFYATPEQVAGGQVYLQPTAKVRYGEVAFQTRWRLDGESRGGKARRYALVLGGPTVPDPPVYGLSRRQQRKLAKLDADYRTLGGTGDDYADVLRASTELVASSFAIPYPVAGPARRVELRTASPDVHWRQCLHDLRADAASLCGPTTSYREGERRRPTWYRGVAPAVYAGSHTSTKIQLPVELSDGAHRGQVADPQATGEETLRLYRNGTELPRQGSSDYFRTPPEPARFRLEHTASPDTDQLPIGTSTETTWTFPSRAPTDPDQWDTQPRLLAVDYQPSTDAKGRLPAWWPVSLGARIVSSANFVDPVRVERGNLRLWASVDQGERWHRAIVVPKPDGTFLTIVPTLFPRPGQSVSVRVEAKAGPRSISQTIVDAYPVH
ncbi:S8 family serine peptidase [Amycolatopsis cihanbeyliensis]